jgi:hypothetical protein
LVVTTASCAGATDSHGGQSPAARQGEGKGAKSDKPSAAVTPDTAAILERVQRAIGQYQLTSRPLACLTLTVVPSASPASTLIDVREKHDQTCGGDPATAPRLFSVQVDTETGQLSSDARSPFGEFEPLGAPPAH